MYQHTALMAHEGEYDGSVGLVVGATKPDAMRDIREAEAEYGYEPAMVLAPGFGKQGGDLEFVRIAGPNAIYPISSGLTKEKYLDGRTPAEAAESWRDKINAELENAEDVPSIAQHVIDNMIREGLIDVPSSPDVVTWPFLKKGRNKLKEAGVEITGLSDEERHALLKEQLEKGIIDESDFTTVFMNIRNVSKSPETSRLLAFLYKKMIEESGVEYDQIGSIAYGAINTGDKVADYLEKPSFLLRKERGTEATHDDIVGGLSTGDKAVMVEDVTTSAGSLIEDVKMLREEYGAEISDAFVFVKRTDEGEEACRDNGINLHYILDMDQLRAMIAQSSAVSEEVREMIAD